MDYSTRINKYIDSHKKEMLEKWEELVRLESYFREKENVEKAISWVKNEFESIDFACNVLPVSEDYAGILSGIWGGELEGAPLVFSGHIDTVHPKGSFEDTLFEIKDGFVYGPGVLDMKGGIIIALYAVKAMLDAGFKERPIKILFAGEEELDHVGTRGSEVFQKEARGAICAFNMETGSVNNALTVQRKTSNTYHVDIIGKGGHSGNDFLIGSNAINEASLKTVEMMKLTDVEEGIYMNTSIISGGTGECAIPDKCHIVYNIRIPETAIGEKLEKKVFEIMNNSYVKGTKTTYELEKANLPAFRKNDNIDKLLKFVNTIAQENGFDSFGEQSVGGAADSGNINAVGVPVLCSCGVRGQFNHSQDEYAVVKSVFERAKIFALVGYNINKFNVK